MSSPQFNQSPSQLAGFPGPVCAAYEDFRRTGDPQSALAVILGALRDFLPDNTPVDKDAPLADSLRLTEDLGYDSLAVAEIVFFIEDLFQVQLESRDLETIKTVGDLKTFVSDRLRARSSIA